MTNKKNLAVKEVEVVLEVLKEYVNSKKDMPYEVLEKIKNKLMDVDQKLMVAEEDYNKTINELLLSNSLLLKFEQLFEMIGTIGTISVEEEDKLDELNTILKTGIDSMKD